MSVIISFQPIHPRIVVKMKINGNKAHSQSRQRAHIRVVTIINSSPGQLMLPFWSRSDDTPFVSFSGFPTLHNPLLSCCCPSPCFCYSIRHTPLCPLHTWSLPEQRPYSPCSFPCPQSPAEGMTHCGCQEVLSERIRRCWIRMCWRDGKLNIGEAEWVSVWMNEWVSSSRCRSPAQPSFSHVEGGTP